MITAQTKLIWNGPKVYNGIISRLRRNITLALHEYLSELKASISIQGSKGYYSYPGDPPFMQSHNLINSIQENYQISSNQLIAEASTDVEYAPTLELGGTLQVADSDKIYASQTVNTWGSAITIAPRPAWVPAFMQTLSKLIAIIAS